MTPDDPGVSFLSDADAAVEFFLQQHKMEQRMCFQVSRVFPDQIQTRPDVVPTARDMKYLKRN